MIYYRVRTGAWNPWKYLKTKVAKSRTWIPIKVLENPWKLLFHLKKTNFPIRAYFNCWITSVWTLYTLQSIFVHLESPYHGSSNLHIPFHIWFLQFTHPLPYLALTIYTSTSISGSYNFSIVLWRLSCVPMKAFDILVSIPGWSKFKICYYRQ
jgi:hypothetical protein